jgi:hypothetical protein
MCSNRKWIGSSAPVIARVYLPDAERRLINCRLAGTRRKKREWRPDTTSPITTAWSVVRRECLFCHNAYPRFPRKRSSWFAAHIPTTLRRESAAALSRSGAKHVRAAIEEDRRMPFARRPSIRQTLRAARFRMLSMSFVARGGDAGYPPGPIARTTRSGRANC